MISIIIPTLNEEKYIGNLLDLIAAQSYPNLEIIVVDASSNDKTTEIARTYEKKLDIKLIEGTEKNASKQRNLGAKEANGDILVFLDADIEIRSENFFGTIAKKIYREFVCAAVTNVYVNPKEEKVFDKIFHFVLNKSILLLNKIGGFGVRGGCMIVRKNIFEKVEGFNENLVVAEDVDLYRKLAKKVRIHFLKELVVYESARRYRKEGYPKVIFKWIANGVYSFFFKKSLNKDWKPVR